MGRPRFCPSYDDSSAQTNGFLGSSNRRTAFIAVYSLTSNGSNQNVAAVVSATLFETEEVSEVTAMDEGTILSGTTAVADRTTVVMPSGKLSASFSYTHQGSECANLVVDAHSNTASATTSMTADFQPTYIRWQQSGFSAASSVTLNICPSETLYFTVTTTLATNTVSPGATSTLVTVVVDAPVALYGINDINPNLYGPLLAGVRAGRMLCDDNNMPTFTEGRSLYIFTNGQGKYVSPCTGSYLVSSTPNCQVYPVVNREGATHLWPAAPSSILAVALTSVAQLNTTALDAMVGEVAGSDLRFAVMLEQVIFQSVYYGSVSGWEFRSWDELAVCTMEFSGTLVNGDGTRLFGQTAPLGYVSTEATCNPDMYSEVLGSLEASTAIITDQSFNSLTVKQQRTTLVAQTQNAVSQGFSECTFVPQEVYLTPYSQSVNCSNKDPCCPLSDQYTRYFYNYCLSEVYTKVTPQINIDSIPDACGVALSYETTTSQVFISTGADAINNIACSVGQDGLDTLRREMRLYYGDCRAAVSGNFDEGLPCITVDDCPEHPEMACLPVDTNLLRMYNTASSSSYRRQKMCMAPTAVFDDLLLDCLIDNMPKISEFALQEQFDTLGLTGTFAENFRALGNTAGCAATKPALLNTYAAYTALKLTTFNAAGQTYNSCYNGGTCPFPVRCVDQYCEMSQGCTYPWGCSTSWDSFATATQQNECVALFHCNYVLPGQAKPESCSLGDQDLCQQWCEDRLVEEVGTADGSFCGYCDDVSGYCYVATQNIAAGSAPLLESACLAAPADDTCFLQDIGRLAATDCGGMGSCDHFESGGDGATEAVTEAECTAAPGLCLTDEGSVMFPQTAGCIGAIQIAGRGCEGQAAVLTDSGCLYRTSVFANEEACLGATDPGVPRLTMRGWLDVVDTEEECLGNELLFVCKVDFAAATPFSGGNVLNSRSVCEARGGVFESPYRWELPTFSAGVAVPLSWMSATAVSSAEWTQRISYPSLSSVTTTLINRLQVAADSTTSQCAYSNVLSVSALAATCSEHEPDDSDDYDEACQPIWEVKDQSAPTQLLGSAIVCDNYQLDDSIDYPSSFSIPPVALQLTNRSNLQGPGTNTIKECTNLQADLKSNSKFAQNRRRIRESSFFIVRQDTDIPALSTLSSSVVANGFVLSDAVRVYGDGTSIDQAWICIETRSEFLEGIRDHYSNDTDWSDFYLTFGVLNDWSVTPMSSYNDRNGESRIASTFLSVEGVSDPMVYGYHFPADHPITDLLSICRRFDSLDLRPGHSEYYVAVLSFNSDPEDVPNGFNTQQTVWLYITACVYIAPVIFLWLPLVVRGALAKQSVLSVPMIATFFLSLFLIFRSALLFGLADGAIVASSTTEFALTDVAVWCEFAALTLLALVITAAVAASNKMRTNKGFNSSGSQQIFFLSIAIFLLAVFVAFVIAYSQTGDSSSGVTSPQTTCEGRVAAGVSVWTPRRILRLSYECLLAVMGLAIGCWLIWISWSINKKVQSSSTGLQLLRLTASTTMLAIMILSHAIIALILIGTEWTNFIFGIIMLYITELVPLIAFFLLSLWKNITEFSSLSFSWRTSGSKGKNGSGSSGGSSTRTQTTTA